MRATLSAIYACAYVPMLLTRISFDPECVPTKNRVEQADSPLERPSDNVLTCTSLLSVGAGREGDSQGTYPLGVQLPTGVCKYFHGQYPLPRGMRAIIL